MHKIKNRIPGRFTKTGFGAIIAVLVIFTACNINKKKFSASDFEKNIEKINLIENLESKISKTDAFWQKLKQNNQVPLTDGENAIFLYKGKAENVSWHGDFNNWSPDINGKNRGINVEGTDLWYLKSTFPEDARIDYKINVDDDWILDPNNTHEQWSGFGPNSELRMPKWKENEHNKPSDKAKKGTITDFINIKSEELGYSIQYQVYMPYGYSKTDELPVLYVTDGSEYIHDKMGALQTVLDNLISLNKMEPIIVVFVDARAPEDTSINRRMGQFSVNPKYLSFFGDTLLPEIKRNYNTLDANTGLIGTSMGGLNAAYFGFSAPDLFNNIAIQSPAFWFSPEIYDLVENTASQPNKIYMSVGTIGDSLEDTRKMKQIFEQKGISAEYLEVNEGHSWGAWSAQLDKILIYFYGK